VYISVRDPSTPTRRLAGRVPGTVVVLGVVSLLTDISTEMVTAVLPLFVTVGLGLSPLAFGVLDSFFQAGTAAARIAGGYTADRLARPKAVAVAGYGLGMMAKVLLLPATGIGALSAAIGVDRVGKGLRTGPRDALIAATSPPDLLGRSFGVHRALDTLGALLGPVVAFSLLMLAPGDFDMVFFVSMCVAGLGVLLLVNRVSEPAPAVRAHAGPRIALRSLFARAGFRRVLIAAGALSLLTVSDAFLYLSLLERSMVDNSVFPLLFLATSLVYLATAIPIGRLSDRYGRTPVFLAGHLGIILAYLVIGLGTSGGGAVLAVVLLGLYYAATDGVLPAATAALVPAQWRSTAISTVQTATALGRSAAALTFGALWVTIGPVPALSLFAVGLAVVVLSVAPTLLRNRKEKP
jgi:MFS family permease